MIQILPVALGILVVGLCLLLLFMAVDKRKTREDLQYINDKLNGIISENSKEKVLCITHHQDIQALLNTLNLLLEHKDKTVSDHKRSQESIRKMLSNISHDLKTPLTVILGCIETIQLDKTLSDCQREALLTRTYEKAREVLDLMNEFFDLARLESDDREIPLERLHMNEIVRKSILSFYDLLNTRGVTVEFEIPDEAIFVLGNEEAMSRVLQNLISNAITHGADGHYLGVTLRSDDLQVYLEVTDKGKGIEEIYYDRIFERMYTLEDSRNKQYQGSGLGLTITRRLVERMNGRITLQSRPFEKTTFFLQFNRLNY